MLYVQEELNVVCSLDDVSARKIFTYKYWGIQKWTCTGFVPELFQITCVASICNFVVRVMTLLKCPNIKHLFL